MSCHYTKIMSSIKPTYCLITDLSSIQFLNNILAGQPIMEPVKLHEWADWPSSIRVANANHSRIEQGKGNKIKIIQNYFLKYGCNVSHTIYLN
jgi:hypothetical protein